MNYKERAEYLDCGELDNGLHIGLAEEADKELEAKNELIKGLTKDMTLNKLFKLYKRVKIKKELRNKDKELRIFKCKNDDLSVTISNNEIIVSDLKCDLEANKKEIAELKQMLEKTVLLLESWNLQTGDEETIELMIEASLLTNKDKEGE